MYKTFPSVVFSGLFMDFYNEQVSHVDSLLLKTDVSFDLKVVMQNKSTEGYSKLKRSLHFVDTWQVQE